MTDQTTPAGMPFPSDEPPSDESADIVAAYMREHGIVLTGKGYWWACKVYQAGRAAALEVRTQAEDAQRLALERITHSYRLLLAGKPVRDVAETLAEADAALAAQAPQAAEPVGFFVPKPDSSYLHQVSADYAKDPRYKTKGQWLYVTPQAPAAQPLIDQNDPAVRDCIEDWLRLDNIDLVPGVCVPLQTSAPVTYPILAAIFEAGYKSGKAS